MTTHVALNPIAWVVKELQLPQRGVEAVVALLVEGNTIPFIARYRKETTGNLDEVQIRDIQEKYDYIQELESRRQTIIASIETQGKLTDELRAQITACESKHILEDLYLPFKPKRRTRAMIAKEKGLEPLALRILEQPKQGSPEQEALAFVSEEKGVADSAAALAGARDIAAEVVAENIHVRACVREAFEKRGVVVSKVDTDKAKGPTKFEQYYDFQESAAKIPSHRYLAIRRGEQEGILQCSIEVESAPILESLKEIMQVVNSSPFAGQLRLATEDAYKRLIVPSVETDLRIDLKMQADRSAVDVFADNLRNLLLSAPLGGRAVIGIDPGIRTGCKCAAVDSTGKYLDCVTLFLSQGDRAMQQGRSDLLAFIAKYMPMAIAIGNGTAGRETEAFVRKLLAEAQLTSIVVVSVSEAGASVYSASDVAREEFPDLDLTIRGAISIARRLQDPLAELVKIDPKAIGVGQYQHDVYQPMLQTKLGEVVESCVNSVGVEVNTASASLLAYVAGIGPTLAQKIVKYRESMGRFTSRSKLLAIPGVGKRTFEQAAGFLRVRGGEHPLDASAVHPERYALVEHIAKDMGIPLAELVANAALADTIDLKRYISDAVGEWTLKDIIAELKKPGRDPRATFEKPCFRDDVMTLSDLKVGMVLEGLVTNVTAFGAFVDVGVHQDGLVHISELTDRFIKDASEVVHVGDKLKVEVLAVDAERKRIAMSARIGRPRNAAASKDKGPEFKPSNMPQKPAAKDKKGFQNNPFASFQL